MRTLRVVLALLFGLGLLAVSPASAQTGSPRNAGLRGGIHITMHTHSNPDPDRPELLFETDRLSFNFSAGENFSYSSRLCGGRAPFNDLGLDFRPNYPGVDDDADGTAPVRHRMQGTITRASGNRGTVQGTTTSVLCRTQGGAQVETENVIVTSYRADFVRASANEVRINGRFTISPTASTGIFRDLTGQGSIQGMLTCLGHQRDPSQPSCAALGLFTDFVGVRGDPTREPGEIRPGLVGTFYDPTVSTG
jgi:hypothetical protein